jgi:hypothetical protein
VDSRLSKLKLVDGPSLNELHGLSWIKCCDGLAVVRISKREIQRSTRLGPPILSLKFHASSQFSLFPELPGTPYD